MIGFLKSFFAGDDMAGEGAAQQLGPTPNTPKKRDVLVLDAYAMGGDEEEKNTGCGSGCGRCGCG
ncbi:MAG: hypothetical protein HY052_04920 [Proteobacteria bacterium]|nr:hypothetical protein [Pseudomonadota bacterium]